MSAIEPKIIYYSLQDFKRYVHTWRTGTPVCTDLKKTHFINKRKITFVPFPKVEAYKNEIFYRKSRYETYKPVGTISHEF